MKRNAMRKNLQQSILKSFGRYIAIVMIIALGSALFVGLLMTKSDMVATGKQFADDQNMFDLRLMSNYGWTQEHVDAVSQMEGVVDAEGLLYQDLIVNINDSTDQSVYRFYAIPEKINRIALRAGRMPEAPNECLADGFHASEEIIGMQVRLADTNTEDALESMRYDTYTVVGYIATPLYMDMNRGTTSVGNGSLSSYFFLPGEAFDLDYFPELHITIPGDYELYSEKYNNAMEAMGDQIEPLLTPYVEERRIAVKAEAEEAYRDGIKEYAEGVWEYHNGKLEAEAELADAHQALLDGEQAIIDNEKKIADGEKQIAQGKATLEQSAATMAQFRQMLDSMKSSTAKQLKKSEASYLAQKEEISGKIQDLDNQIAAVDSKIVVLQESMGDDYTALEAIEAEISRLEASIAATDVAIQAAQAVKEGLGQVSSEYTEELTAQIDARIAEMEKQKASDTAAKAQLEIQRSELEAKLPLDEYDKLKSEKQKLENQRAVQQASLMGVERSLQTVQNEIANIDSRFASMEEELAAGEQQIASGRWQLQQAEKELEDGKIELEKAKVDIADGWIEYEEGKLEAETELADAQLELADAKEELKDARELIDGMTDNTVFVLNRNSNIGYNSLDSASDIVQGVSRVFPAFFLLVASLVCITTMTRMIDEERTQIGTLKALGYSNGAIISKYLIYAGSGAVIGCGLGVLVGSAIFPTILWQAYKIMLYITDDLVLKVNWVLCGIVVGTYTTVMLLVTWYCCRKTLQEEPAELIRPKAPDVGKKIFLERLPIWQKISFLNKVTIRNIFRYRQRLAMMMVGIGGCTALLLTGFGLRDSIVNVVDYQFEEVTTYDMSVYFAEGQTQEQQAAFLKDVRPYAENAMFYHQSSVDLEFSDKTKEIYLIAAEDQVTTFIDLHSGEERLSLPKANEVVLSVGAAEAMGISVGDSILMRNADLQELKLTVSGIYDNHVENYAIIIPETIESQWNMPVQMQMAFIQVREGQDVHEVSAELTGMSGVMNVSVSEDLAHMVGNMMEALDLVVIVIVFSAGLLAAVVLYNLTNININERIREIATIKVLGFNASETAAYIFKENLSLTVIGSIVGLGMGYLLLLFVMSQIKIDMVWFKALLMPQSYALSFGLTMLSACLVDFVFYFNLEKINMAEALKSVE